MTEEEYTILIECDEEQKHFIITMSSGREVSPTDFVAAMQDFVDQVAEAPNDFFDNFQDNPNNIQ